MRHDMESETSHFIHHVGNVLRLLIGEEKLFRVSNADTEGLKVELEIVRAFVNDFFKPRQAAKELSLEEVADTLQRVQFVVDAYLCQVEQHQHKRGVVDFFYAKNESARNSQKSTVKRIHKISQRAEDMKASYSRLEKHMQGSKNTGVGLLENAPRFFEENELLNVKSQKQGLLHMVVGGPSTRLVISLAGIAGVGKTTLASIVYQSDDVRRHFDSLAWINVSQSYDFRNLFNRLTKMICPDEDLLEGEMGTRPEPIDHLYQYLFSKRYMIVFDGVWQTDFFEFMNEFLPDKNNGSRIIITTRDNLIAASSDMVQRLHPLSEENALQLFRKSLSRYFFSPESEVLSLETVRRCHGLPLVIWAMGDLFSCNSYLSPMEEVMSKWKLLLDKFEDEIGENLPHIEEVSRNFYHNYDDLSSRSRLCLMYFGVFPKDYLISDAKLVKLWIAEGFVKEEAGKTLEQVAEAYLNELINKNLVQVSQINYDGSERMCRVHGFMHHIISSRAERYKIYQDLNKTTPRLSVDDEVRRLSIYGDAISTLEITTEHPHICSVFIFDVNETMRKSFVASLFERFKHLELLDFENAPLDDLPNEVGNLSLLKYLSLRNTKVKKLPNSVGQLLNLQSLDVRNTMIHELPIHIRKLRKLRHLLGSAYNNQGSLDSVHGVQIKEGIGCLENLQTLMTVEARRSAGFVIEEFEKLRQLRCLSISKLTTDMVITLCSFIERMNHLESLNLYLSDDRETFDLESISSPPPLLRRLILKGRLEKLPDWILGLQHLSVLGLSFSRLATDPLNALQSLPNLKFLWLHGAYDGEQLHFEGVSFQKLKQLVLTELQNLRRLIIERGALPMLEELRVETQQNDFSFDIQHLRNLQLLECYDMSDEFVLRLQPEGGSEYWKVKHVPSVVFRYHVHGNQYVSYRLGEPGLMERVKGLIRTTSNVELYGRQLSFFYNDDDEVARISNAEWSDQYSFFTDDIED